MPPSPKPSPRPGAGPGRRALLIGNAAYADDRLARLAVPERDVRAFEAVLRDPAICGFDAVEVLLDADGERIRRAIERLFRNAARDDLLLLYFSGHGLLDQDGALNLALTNTSIDYPLSSTLDTDFIRKAMNRSASRRQVLILDCCHSGAYASGAKADGSQGIGTTVATQATFDVQGYGRVALLSSTATQLSWEGERIIGDTDRSLFTHHLVEGLQTGAAAPDAAEIRIRDLYDYAHREVLAHQSKQTPQLWLDGPQTGDLIIARNPDPPASTPPDPLRPELRAALEDPSHLTREGAVRAIGRLMRKAGADRRAALAAALRAHADDERHLDVLEAIEETLKESAAAGGGSPAKRREAQPAAAESREPPADQAPVPGPVPREGEPMPPRWRIEPFLRLMRVYARLPWRAALMIIVAALLLHVLGVFILPFWPFDERGGDRDNESRPAFEPAQTADPPVPASPPVDDGASLEAPDGSAGDTRSVSPRDLFRDRLKDGSEGPEMIALPGGCFEMGSPEDEVDRDRDERRHEVCANPFAIGRTEVTFDEYDRFADETGRDKPGDAGWGRGARPVINVSWKDANAYADWLSQQTGEAYRLPTEAEWEYAARADTETPFWTGDCIHTDQANYNGKVDYNDCGAKTDVYRGQTLAAESLPANPWGLHEVLGNVWEWTCSEYEASYPVYNKGQGPHTLCTGKTDVNGVVLRGGSWKNYPGNLRAANRYGFRPGYRFEDIGFRLARTFSP